MSETRMITFSIQEEPEILELIKQRAREEGTSKSAIVRRAIRKELFSLPGVPIFGNTPEVQPTEQAA